MADDMPPESVNFDRAVAIYDETRGFPPGVERHIAELIAQVGQMTHNSRVLEIGIGTGRISLPLMQHSGPIYGVDISAAMLRLLLRKRKSGLVYPSQADAAHLPFPNHSFDAAVVAHVFHLVADLPAVISELARVLKPGAYLVHCFNRDNRSFQELINSWRGAIDLDVARRWERVDRALPDAGWMQIGDVWSLEYTKQNSLGELIDHFKRRIWSATWNLTDEELARGVELMQAHVNENYKDPHQLVTATHTFHAAVFQPPDA